MTEKEKKPLTKRDVAKYVCGRMAFWGSALVTDTIIYTYGLPVAKASKHPTLNSASIIMSALALSYGVGKATIKYSDEFIDDVCDCIVMIDDFKKEALKAKNSVTKEEAREEILSRMNAEHMA